MESLDQNRMQHHRQCDESRRLEPESRLPARPLPKHPAPLEIRDAWNNLVLQVGIEDYTRYFNPPSSLAPFRLSPTRAERKHLTAGRYRMSLTAEATNLHHLEAWERTFDLPLPPREALSIVLPVWKRPRMGVIWTNSFDMVLLPIPGNPRALMARTETSLGQFRRYAMQAGIGDWPIESVGANGSEQQGHTWQSPGRNAEDSHPVVGVSWMDARAFCRWLTEHEQAYEGLAGTQRYELPSTEQWSQVAGTNRYPWGATFPPAQNQGNYAGREVRETDVARTDWPPEWAPAVLEQYQDPHSVGRSHVGSYEANVTAFADLGGNAAEWCSTPYDPSLNRLDQWTLKPSRLKQPNALGDLRVVRGASWADSHPDLLRTDAHWAEPASTRNDRIGFRVVLVEDFP
jgi:formylglycine-generating enzyme required for sulfatase activity